MITHAGATVLLRNQHAHQTQFTETTKDLPWKILRLIPLHNMGTNLTLRKITGHLCHLKGQFTGLKLH